MRNLFVGFWVCIVTVISVYAAGTWSAQQTKAKPDEPYFEGLEYRRTPTLTIPMIEGGAVQGYVMAKFVFTADARTLRELPFDPTAFVASEAFNEVYVNGKINLQQLEKYNLKEIAETVKKNVNARLNGQVVEDVLIDGLNYIDKSDIRRPSGRPPVPSGADVAPAATQPAH